MTHMLHRCGSIKENQQDFTILSMPARGYNDDKECIPKLRRTMEIFLDHNPINVGLGSGGNLYTHSTEELIDRVSDNAVQATYDNKIAVKNVLTALKNENLHISVVVQGIVEDVIEICKEVGLTPHSMDQSLGIWGDKSLMPEKNVLKIVTMCGHGMISVKLVQDTIKRINAGRLSLEEGAKRMARLCHCGVFNTKKAEMLLRGILKE